jgi:hypothetical protein
LHAINRTRTNSERKPLQAAKALTRVARVRLCRDSRHQRRPEDRQRQPRGARGRRDRFFGQVLAQGVGVAEAEALDQRGGARGGRGRRQRQQLLLGVSGVLGLRSAWGLANLLLGFHVYAWLAGTAPIPMGNCTGEQRARSSVG